MNRLDTGTRARVLSSLLEGLGVRPASRATGVAVNTIQKLIRDMGPAARRFHEDRVVSLGCQRIEADEAWGFVYARKRNVPAHLKGTGAGDVWVWTAVCADTKIVPAWYVGGRDRIAAFRFLAFLDSRMATKIELNTDGHNAYWASLQAFRQMPDYARLVKYYGTPNGRWNDRDNRYEQPRLTGVLRERICGEPDTENASTSYAERMNLGLRMHNQKMRRLTNGHAKRLEMLEYSTSLYYCYYNWAKSHGTLGGQTPAMANGLTDHRWTVAALVEALDAYAAN